MVLPEFAQHRLQLPARIGTPDMNQLLQLINAFDAGLRHRAGNRLNADQLRVEIEVRTVVGHVQADHGEDIGTALQEELVGRDVPGLLHARFMTGGSLAAEHRVADHVRAENLGAIQVGDKTIVIVDAQLKLLNRRRVYDVKGLAEINTRVEVYHVRQFRHETHVAVTNGRGPGQPTGVAEALVLPRRGRFARALPITHDIPRANELGFGRGQEAVEKIGHAGVQSGVGGFINGRRVQLLVDPAFQA